MPSERFFVHKEDGSLVRLKGRLVRFLDEEPPTGSDKSAIRTALEVSPDAEGLVQADVGTGPQNLVLHQHLGDLAYQSSDGVSAAKIEVESTTGTATTQALTVTDGTDTNFVVQEDGKTGIGGVTPSTTLHIRSDSDKNLELGTLGNKASIAALNDARSAYVDMRIDADNLIIGNYSGGKVGIGTASPNTLLECYDTVKPVIRLSGSGNDADGTNYGSIEFYNRDASIDGPNVGAQIHVESSSVNGAGGELVFSTERSSSEGEGSAPLERVRIDDSGRVGIGTASPGNLLEVAGATPRVEINSTSGSPELLFSDGGASKFYVQYDTALDRLRFVKSGVGTRWAIDSSGNLVANSTGIDFGAVTTSAGQGTDTTGSVSNSVLSDYEFGSWTPEFSTSGADFTTMTMDVLAAQYVKVGRHVHCQAYIRTDNVDATGASGGVIVQGLPFLADATTDNFSTLNVGYSASWVNAPAAGYVQPNAPYVRLTRYSTTGASVITPSDLTAGASADRNTLIFSLSYIAST